MLSAGNAEHFVFGFFKSFSGEDEAKYRHSNMRTEERRSVEECIQSLFICRMALNIPDM